MKIISGPIVEGSFNIMGDIYSDDRTRLLPENYEAMAIVKRRLLASGHTSATITATEQMKKAIHHAYKNYNAAINAKNEESSDHLQPRGPTRTPTK